MPSGRIDFRRVADAALASLETLLAEWLPGGHRDGHEYKALNPTRADAKIGSFSVNLNTGAWGDFATDDKGGDAISLYAYLQGISQLDAAKRLAEQLRVAPTPSSAPAQAPAQPGHGRRSEWRPILPIPAEAGEVPKAHIKRGRPEQLWRYRSQAGELLGAVYRFRTSDGGKEVLPCVWAEHETSGAREWRWLAFPEPRPLYGLERLNADTTHVVIVEGEKCADALQGVLPATRAAMTWPGGSKAVDKADWLPLKGRKVIIWPDCDAQVGKDGTVLAEAAQPGMRAAERVAEILVKLSCEVRVVEIPAPGAKPSGWDVADAIEEGWSRDQVQRFIVDHLRLPKCVGGASTPAPAAPADEWKRDLVRGASNALLAVVPNAFLMLANRDEWRGVLAFDEFAQRPLKRAPPPYERGVAGDWEANDDSMAAFWLATRAGLTKLSSAQAAEAAEMAARAAPFDPVREYLQSLVWDQQPRLAHWVSDFLGAPASPYAALVGTFWLIGMAKRVFEPGCKFDYMPILEGPQGRGKSSALEALGSPWFGNTDFVMGDKDSMAVMQGKWLYEIAELDSFNKADTTRVKSFVSRQVDEFRPAYGRRIMRIPRRVVLVGSTNQYEYFKDASGNRRFWPIKCVDQIDVDALRDARDQLLAEAVVRYRAGERTFPTRQEQDELFTPEQEIREIGDAWEDGVRLYLESPNLDGVRPQSVSTFDVLTNGLRIEAGKITKEMSTRIGIVMRKLHWIRRERRNEHPRYVYERPEKSAEVTAAHENEDADVPF